MKTKIFSNEVKIERGVPFPISHKEIFLRMKVGDSLIISHDKQASFTVSSYKYGVKVRKRRVNDDQFRFWRVE